MSAKLNLIKKSIYRLIVVNVILALSLIAGSKVIYNNLNKDNLNYNSIMYDINRVSYLHKRAQYKIKEFEEVRLMKSDIIENFDKDLSIDDKLKLIENLIYSIAMTLNINEVNFSSSKPIFLNFHLSDKYDFYSADIFLSAQDESDTSLLSFLETLKDNFTGILKLEKITLRDLSQVDPLIGKKTYMEVKLKWYDIEKY